MFRPCIDLHQGQVKQIVGGSLLDHNPDQLRTNFISDRPAAWYADLYRRDGLFGGHVIMLGPGNETAARDALAAFPGGLQIGGGITIDNAQAYLAAGAAQVIVTSWAFRDGQLQLARLAQLAKAIGRQRLVLDLSCRWREEKYFVVTNRWQVFTQQALDAELFRVLAPFCAEFLVHGVDVEGLGQGIDLRLVEQLSAQASLPVTYAGGARSMADLEAVTRIGRGQIDLTIGSALDIFGGNGVRYADAVAFNRRQARASAPGTGI